MLFEDIVRFLFEELDVEPARADWSQLLAENVESFRQDRTWGHFVQIVGENRDNFWEPAS